MTFVRFRSSDFFPSEPITHTNLSRKSLDEKAREATKTTKNTQRKIIICGIERGGGERVAFDRMARKIHNSCFKWKLTQPMLLLEWLLPNQRRCDDIRRFLAI